MKQNNLNIMDTERDEQKGKAKSSYQYNFQWRDEFQEGVTNYWY